MGESSIISRTNLSLGSVNLQSPKRRALNIRHGGKP